MDMAPRTFKRDGLRVEIRAVERNAELRRFDWDEWASVPSNYDQNVMVISRAGQPLCAYWYAREDQDPIYQMCSPHSDEDEDVWVEYLITEFGAADWDQIASILRNWAPLAAPEPRTPTPELTCDFDVWGGLRDLAVRVKLANIDRLTFEDVTLTLQPMPVPCTHLDQKGEKVTRDRFSLELHQNGELLARYKFVWDAARGQIFEHPHFDT
jgi:hypothetical protein